MSGIALIIPGADFSNSPLGQVTFQKTLAEKTAEAVEAYATAIGSHTYDEELNTLVLTLMGLGVWDNLSLFPMLGDTVAKKLVNLNPNTEFGLKTIVVPDTATVSNGKLTFTQASNPTNFIGESGSTTAISHISISYDNMFQMAAGKFVKDSINTGSLTTDVLRIATYGGGTPTLPCLIMYYASSYVESTAGVTNILGTDDFFFGHWDDGTNDNLINGSEIHESIATKNPRPVSFDFYNGLGCGKYSGISSVSNTQLWNGYVDFYVFGKISTRDKALRAAYAINEFVNAIRNV